MRPTLLIVVHQVQVRPLVAAQPASLPEEHMVLEGPAINTAEWARSRRRNCVPFIVIAQEDTISDAVLGMVRAEIRNQLIWDPRRSRQVRVDPVRESTPVSPGRFIFAINPFCSVSINRVSQQHQSVDACLLHPPGRHVNHRGDLHPLAAAAIGHRVAQCARAGKACSAFCRTAQRAPSALSKVGGDHGSP